MWWKMDALLQISLLWKVNIHVLLRISPAKCYFIFQSRSPSIEINIILWWKGRIWYRYDARNPYNTFIILSHLLIRFFYYFITHTGFNLCCGSYSLFSFFLLLFTSILFAHQKRLLLSEGVTSISIFPETIFWHAWSLFYYICKAAA